MCVINFKAGRCLGRVWKSTNLYLNWYNWNEIYFFLFKKKERKEKRNEATFNLWDTIGFVTSFHLSLFFLFLSMAAAACSPSFSFLLPFLQRSLCLSSAGLMKFDGDRACNYRLSRADACLALNSLTGEFVIIRKRGGWFNLFSPLP